MKNSLQLVVTLWLFLISIRSGAMSLERIPVCFPGAEGNYGQCLQPRAAKPEELADQYDYGNPFTDASFSKNQDPKLYLAPKKYLDLKTLPPHLALTKNLITTDVLNTTRYPFGIFAPSTTEKLQSLMGLLGHGIQITSGYRSPGYNSTLPGAAKWSRHLYGDAVDIGASGKQIPELESGCKQLQASYIQLYTDHVHCDWRLNPLPEGYFESTQERSPLTPTQLAENLADSASVRVEMLQRDPEGQWVRISAWTTDQEDGGILMSRWYGSFGERLSPELILFLKPGNFDGKVWVGGSLPKSFHIEIPRR